MASARDHLLMTLADASSQQPERLKAAEAQLKEWEGSPNFLVTLQDIFLDQSVDQRVRWLAVIYLKNGIDRFWRRTSKDEISNEEKSRIRSRLLELLGEPVSELATQNAVLVSKIARIDFPTEWPDVFQSLIGSIHASATTPDANVARRMEYQALQMLNLIIKALCTNRLPSGKRLVQEIAPGLLQFTSAIYVQRFNTIALLASGGAGEALDDVQQIAVMQITYASLKCMRRLLVHGFADFAKVPAALDVYSQLLMHLPLLVNWITPGFNEATRQWAVKCNPAWTQVLQKHATLIGKVYLDLEEYRLCQFINAPGSLDVVKFYWDLLIRESSKLGPPSVQYGDGGHLIFDNLLLHALRILKGVIRACDFTVVPSGNPEDEERAAEQTVRRELLTPDFLIACAEILVTRYMVLRPQDLEAWSTDPECADTEHWEFDLRPCAENVFMDLFARNRELLTPCIIKMLESVSASESDMFLRDAVYAAVGLGANELYDSVDFDSWFMSRLFAEASVKGPGYEILRRRIALLVGRWVKVKVAKSTRPKIYEMLSNFMNDDQLFVRMAAVHSLKNCLDDWDFEAETFAPYFVATVESLIKVMGDVSEVESSMKALKCITLITERMEQQIAPFAQTITEMLPQLWRDAGDQHIFQALILETLTKLMNSLKEQSTALNDFVAPLIQHSTDPGLPAHVYLLDDGLELWQVVLQNAAQQCGSCLFELLPNAVRLLDFGTESLKKTLKILDCYILLAPEFVAQNYGIAILEAFSRLFHSLATDGVVLVMKVTETMIQVCPIEVVSIALEVSGFLHTILTEIIKGNAETRTMVFCFAVLSRLVVTDWQVFLRMMAGAATNIRSDGSFMGTLLDAWINKFDNIGHPRQRKLNAMALTSLITTKDRIILNRFPAIMAVWSDVLNDVKESSTGDARIYWSYDEDDDEDLSPERRRKAEVAQRDPVHTVNLRSLIRAKLQESQEINGGPAAFQEKVLRDVDPVTSRCDWTGGPLPYEPFIAFRSLRRMQ